MMRRHAPRSRRCAVGCEDICATDQFQELYWPTPPPSLSQTHLPPSEEAAQTRRMANASLVASLLATNRQVALQHLHATRALASEEALPLAHLEDPEEVAAVAAAAADAQRALEAQAALQTHLCEEQRDSADVLIEEVLVPGHLAGEAAEEGAEEEEKDEAALTARCTVCGKADYDVHTNEILLCDGKGCERAHHMQCLPTPLGKVPEGDWFCPDCKPSVHTVWTAESEHTMELDVGTQLWARDRKGQWGAAMVLSSKTVEGGLLRLVGVRWKGFGAKYNEKIATGDGRLRRLDLGPPLEGFGDSGGVFLVSRVSEMRTRAGEHTGCSCCAALRVASASLCGRATCPCPRRTPCAPSPMAVATARAPLERRPQVARSTSYTGRAIQCQRGSRRATSSATRRARG